MMRILLGILAALAATLLLAVPAAAGGWAVTLLDPLPDRIEVGQAYTVGYWVLQHGSHPSQIALGETGLKLIDEQGQETYFRGVALPEPAHFAAAIAIPHAGSWRMFGMQGPFAPYEVGTLQVPGRLTVLATPSPMEMPGHDDHVWGAIHPPQLAGEATAHAPTQPPALQSEPQPVAASAGPWEAALLGVVFALVLLAGAVVWTRRRSSLSRRIGAGLLGLRDRLAPHS